MPPKKQWSEAEMWVEERRGACVLLAGLADWRADLCRKAALDGNVWISPSITRLLLDAAEECRRAGGPR